MRECYARARAKRVSSKLLSPSSPKKNFSDNLNLDVQGISDVTLIRTDTTLDHSQKAEKVCVRRGDLRKVHGNKNR